MVDLKENAIIVQGEVDGIFDQGDLIIFYGQDPDTYAYNDISKGYSYQNNPYSDTSFYFLNFSQSNGLRIGTQQNAGLGFPVIKTFDHYQVYETDRFNIIQHPSLFFVVKFYHK